MKHFVRLVAMAGLTAAASCGHSAVTPAQAAGNALAFAKTDAIPRTVHVIPFYDYGKSGYQALGLGGNGGLIGSETALYGATVLGGDAKCSTPYDSGSNTGCGIVYRLLPSTGRTYKIDVLHTFKGAPGDGAASLATLRADKSGDLGRRLPCVQAVAWCPLAMPVALEVHGTEAVIYEMSALVYLYA